TIHPAPTSTLFPYTTLFRSINDVEPVPYRIERRGWIGARRAERRPGDVEAERREQAHWVVIDGEGERSAPRLAAVFRRRDVIGGDRKSTRLNSSHRTISYAV